MAVQNRSRAGAGVQRDHTALKLPPRHAIAGVLTISCRQRAPEIGEVDLVLFGGRILRDKVRAMIPKPGCCVVVTDRAARLDGRSGGVAEMHEPDTGKAPACRLDELFHGSRNGMPRVGGIVPWPKVRLARRDS